MDARLLRIVSLEGMRRLLEIDLEKARKADLPDEAERLEVELLNLEDELRRAEEAFGQ